MKNIRLIKTINLISVSMKVQINPKFLEGQELII